MPLTPGTRIGPYEVVGSLGAGGMGEVYRARDTKLNRDVALKILPEAFVIDSDRLARFKREAQVLASLNHSNIAQIYGFEDASATHALVMELVDGLTLADRIAQGPIATPDALPIARQIADALEAAHERGIIHRDLKPANIILKGAWGPTPTRLPDGSRSATLAAADIAGCTVKVLDFGLAKALAPEGANATADAMNSPTLTTPAMTQMGLILGTAAYMSPEQAKGRAVDKRADIWAFGVVLYEMLTGRPLFHGESVAETIGFVATRDPDWTTLPASTPAGVRRLLARCLTRDPKHRLRDVGEARIALSSTDEWDSATDGLAPGVVRRPPRERMMWIGIALATAAFATVATWLLKPQAHVTNVVTRFSYQLPQDQPQAIRSIAVSPDGTKLAYAANRQIYVRALDQLEAQPVIGSNENPDGLAFSPDGAWIAYFSRIRTRSGGAGTLRKIPVAGGSPQTICELATPVSELSWRGDTIVFGQDPGTTTAIQAVAASGGAPRTIATTDEAKEIVMEPQLLADGRHLLMTYARNDGDSTYTVVVQPLEGGTRHELAKPAYDARILPSGHLIYRSGRKIYGAAFDSTRLEIRGTPVTLVEGVRFYAVSDSGTLAFIPGDVVDTPQQNTLVWVDRQGRETPLAAKPRAFTYPRISPDGTRVVVDSRDEEHDLWIWNIARETLSRLTFGRDEAEGYPIWTIDGQEVIYRVQAQTGDEIFRRRADGTGNAESLTKGPLASPHSLSSDGKQLVYRDSTEKSGRDLFVLPLAPPGPPKPIIETGFQEENGEVSPDGRWIAYESNESGAEANIYVRPFPAVDAGKWQVSSGGGWSPMWSRNSRELFYRSAKEFLVSDIAASSAGTAFTFSKPRVLFPFAGYLFAATRTYDISPDGRRFLMVKTGIRQVAPTTVTVVTNWFDEVRARVKGK